jgi:hypothetical protein
MWPFGQKKNPPQNVEKLVQVDKEEEIKNPLENENLEPLTLDENKEVNSTQPPVQKAIPEYVKLARRTTFLDDARSGHFLHERGTFEHDETPIDTVDEETGNGALFYAVEYNRIDVVKYLVDNGANINIKNKEGNTALIRAVNSVLPYKDIIIYLVEHGADINIKNNEGKTAVSIVSDRLENVKKHREDNSKRIETIKMDMLNQEANLTRFNNLIEHYRSIGNTRKVWTNKQILENKERVISNSKAKNKTEKAIETAKKELAEYKKLIDKVDLLSIINQYLKAKEEAEKQPDEGAERQPDEGAEKQPDEGGGKKRTRSKKPRKTTKRKRPRRKSTHKKR